MIVEKLADGLWRWTTAHPAWTDECSGPEGWPRDVGCVYFEPAGGGVILIDPLVPTDDAERARFFRALDADVERRHGPVTIALTNGSHGRSAAELRTRYGAGGACRVVAHADAAAIASAPVDDPFGTGPADLAGGLRAHRLASMAGGECVVELPAGAGLAFGDAVLGVEAGGVRLCPAAWVGGPAGLLRLAEELRALLEMPFERLLPSHGPIVPSGARAALAGAIRAAVDVG